MTPTRSNLNRETCSPVSSNCVIWQGPDIPCLNLCKGDSISDVLYKLATEVCTLIDNMGISAVDLSVIITKCLATPEPEKTLTNVLNLIIDKVVCIADELAALPPVPDAYVEPTYIPSAYPCLSTGSLNNSTPLPISQFVELITNQLCTLSDTVENLVGDVQQNTADIELIQNTYYSQPEDLPTASVCITGQTLQLSDAIEQVADTVCDYIDTLGSTAELIDVQNLQCTGLNDAPTLCGGGKQLMSGLKNITGDIGWNTTVTTLAESLQNLWFTVCDIRCAVKLIQENCCKVSCADIVIDFDYKWIDATTLKLFFFPKTTVPNGFYDCGDNGDANPGSGQTFTFTDGNGNTWDATGLHFRYQNPTNNTGIVTDSLTQTQGYILDLSNANALDVTTGLTVTSNVCFTDGTNNCIKCVTKTIAAYNDGMAVVPTCCTISASKPVTITYKTCVDTTT